MRKERLEVALRSAPEVRSGCIDVELESEDTYSVEDYVKRFPP